jgi:hypothetical protein
MATHLLTKVQRDHLDSLTRANGVNALSELIWNALDADATQIQIRTEKSQLGAWNTLIVEDNGHGLSRRDALSVFESIGGSQKRNSPVSPGHRSFHGKEGRGRYKALALGNHVSFKSTYLGDDGMARTFAIDLHREIIDRPVVHDAVILDDGSKVTGFRVVIKSLNQGVVSKLFTKTSLDEITEKFAIYSMTYPDFKILVGNQELDFQALIRNTESEDRYFQDTSNRDYNFNIQVVEWNFDCHRKIYLCNRNGVTYRDIPAGIRPGLPICIVISSPYIDRLQLENRLDMGELDPTLNDAIIAAKSYGRRYARERLHQRAQQFIDDLKSELIYPYKGDATTEVEHASRQVFDIVALQVNEFLPSFNEQGKKGKQLTLSLIKEALENDTSSLRRILTEVIELPESKLQELAELLDQTPLSNIIDTMKEVTNRLSFLQALERLIYDQPIKENILEHKNLHKIIVNETWIFGDTYTYGVDDEDLKAMLQEHLKHLGRVKSEEDLKISDNLGMNNVPNVCIGRQFSNGQSDNFLNLVVEIKQPTMDVGRAEVMQFMDYATSVSEDTNLPKNNHSWRFVLLVRDIKPELKNWVTPKDRDYGHIVSGESVDVYVLKWSDIISAARVKYEYIRESLNISLSNDEQCMKLLQDKYRQYLPEYPMNDKVIKEK